LSGLGACHGGIQLGDRDSPLRGQQAIVQAKKQVAVLYKLSLPGKDFRHSTCHLWRSIDYCCFNATGCGESSTTISLQGTNGIVSTYHNDK
jgi:hypothetical protein